MSSTTKSLLVALRGNARASNFHAAADNLRTLMTPWGVSPKMGRYHFTFEDNALANEFWALSWKETYRVLTEVYKENPNVCPTAVEMHRAVQALALQDQSLIEAAARDPFKIRLDLAEGRCLFLAKLCDELLETPAPLLLTDNTEDRKRPVLTVHIGGRH